MSGPLAGLVLDGLSRVAFTFASSGLAVPGATMARRSEELFAGSGTPVTLAALLTNDPASVEVVLGAIARGARLVSLPLPPRAADVERYASFVGEALAACGADTIILRDDLAALVEPFAVARVVRHSELAPGRLVGTDGTFELIQFSSGSTGDPTPIALDEDTLAANIDAILERVQPGSGDTTVSWLPLSHDMGLIGMVLASLCAADDSWTEGADLVLLEPEQFLRQPATWIDAIAQWRATFTAAPDFGYRLAAERTPTDPRDLSTLRHAIIGGEIVRPSTLRSFEERFAACSLRPTALAPAYGMAELGVAAAMTAPDEVWRSTTAAVPDPDGPAGVGPSFELASSGRPLDGYRVEVAPDTGRISLGVPSAGRAVRTGLPLADESGLLETSDTGFLEDGWLYVTGRCDDVIVAHGRNLHAPQIEAAVSGVAGVRFGRVTAVGDPSGEWAVVAELVGRPEAHDQAAMVRAVRAAAVGVARVAPDHVVLVPSGSLPMTSSGKVQRHAVRARWTAGRF